MENNNYSTDYKKGFQDGVKNKAISDTTKMLEIGFDKKLISDIIGLSENEIAIVEETLHLNQHNVDKIIEEAKSDIHIK